MGGAAGEPPGVQVPGHGALHRGRDKLSDTLHMHFTPPFTTFILCMFRSINGGAAGEPPEVQVPGRGALHRGGDTLPDTPHRHFTLLPSQPLFCICSGAWVGGAAGEHPWAQVPGVVPCKEAEIHSQTHYIGTSHSSLHSLYSAYVQEHEWVVQPVNIHEFRFQDVVPWT